MCHLRWLPSWRRTRKCSTATIRQGGQSDRERLGQALSAEIPGQRNRRFFFVEGKERSPGIVLLGRDPGAEYGRTIRFNEALSQAPRQKVERVSLPEGFTSLFE